MICGQEVSSPLKHKQTYQEDNTHKRITKTK